MRQQVWSPLLVVALALGCKEPRATITPPDEAAQLLTSPVQDTNAILIQDRHAGPVDRISVAHDANATYVESTDLTDVRVYRRLHGEDEWRLYRQWNVLLDRWNYTNDHRSEYKTVQSPGLVELYRGGELVARLPSTTVPDEAATFLVPPYGSSSSMRVFAFPVDRDGERGIDIYGALNGRDFGPMLFAGLDQAVDLYDLTQWTFALEDHDGHYTLHRVGEAGQVTPISLPGAPKQITSVWQLGEGVFAVAGEDPALTVAATPFSDEKPGIYWQVYQWEPSGSSWVDAHDSIGVAARQIIGILPPEDGFGFTLELREEHDDYDLRRRRYVVHAGQIKDVRALDPAFDHPLHALFTAARGEIIGVQEVGDSDGDGHWGSRHYRARRGDRLVPLPELLPGLPSKAEIIDVVDFGYDRGIGVKLNGEHFEPSWRWYLRDGDGWAPASGRLDGLASDTSQIVDIQLGLIRATSHRKGRSVETWFALDLEAGTWTSVASLMGSIVNIDDATLVDVDARSNSLKLVMRDASGRAFHRLVYRDHQGSWQPAPELGRGEAELTVETLGRAAAVERTSAGDTALIRATSPLHSEDLHVLQREGSAWTRIRTVRDGQQQRWSWRNGLLEQVDARDGARAYYLHHEGQWSDVRKLVASPPADVLAAFAFADGHGLALQDLGRAAWSYYLDDGSGRFGALQRQLPNSFPTIATVFGFSQGLGVAVQEAGDTDGDGIAGSWRYYVRKGRGWADLRAMLPSLPTNIETIRGSADGRLLLVQEQWDDDGDGAAFEWTVAHRDSLAVKFQSLPSVAGMAQICDGKVFANGRGLALRGCEADANWRVFRRKSGRLEPISDLPNDYGEQLASDEASPAFAVKQRGQDQWRILTLEAGGAQRVLADRQPTAVRIQADSLALRSSATEARASQWEWHRLTGATLERLGRSGERPWFGIDHEDRRTTIVFDGAKHFVDGAARTGVPRSQLWLHGDARALDGDTVFHAPTLLAELVPGQTDANRVLAYGGGEAGRVLVYRSGSSLFAVAVTDGELRVEQRPRLDGNGEQAFLVNAFTDGTERWYRWDDPSKSISAYQRDGDRVFYSDEGYFFSETDAMSERMTFRVAGEVYSFFQLGAHLFRPDILEQRLGLPLESLFELTPLDRQRISKARTLSPAGVELGALRPPSLRLLSTTASRTSEPSVEIEVAAQGIGVTDAAVTARVLGAGQARALEFEAAPNEPEHAEVAVTREVNLLPGLNEIELTVIDADGLSDSRRVTVEYIPTTPPKPTLWLLIAATGEYDEGQFGSLPLTQEDAQTIRRSFETQTELFAQVKVRSLCQRDGCDGVPTRGQVLDGLRDLSKQAAPGDSFVLYVSGHGTKIGDSYYLVPEDGKQGAITSLIAWSEVFNALRAFPIGKKLVILDTCHAGAALQNERDKGRFIQQTVERDGVYILAATAADAKAYELRDLGNGLFTHVLEEGLAGGADADGDGRVSFEELAFHLGRRVRELSKAKGLRMEPYMPLIRLQMDFDLALVNRRVRVLLRVIESSDFGMTEKPERVRYWKKAIEGVTNVSWANNRDAAYVLSVIETDGKPVRAQLEIPGASSVQWEFEAGTQNVLAELTRLFAND